MIKSMKKYWHLKISQFFCVCLLLINCVGGALPNNAKKNSLFWEISGQGEKSYLLGVFHNHYPSWMKKFGPVLKKSGAFACDFFAEEIKGDRKFVEPVKTDDSVVSTAEKLLSTQQKEGFKKKMVKVLFQFNGVARISDLTERKECKQKIRKWVKDDFNELKSLPLGDFYGQMKLYLLRHYRMSKFFYGTERAIFREMKKKSKRKLKCYSLESPATRKRSKKLAGLSRKIWIGDHFFNPKKVLAEIDILLKKSTEEIISSLEEELISHISAGYHYSLQINSNMFIAKGAEEKYNLALRDQDMVNTAEKVMKKGSVFMVVGAAHIPGMVKKLKKAGYTCMPILASPTS